MARSGSASTSGCSHRRRGAPTSVTFHHSPRC
uniref:Uncharacterized protein n=1 Tax=Arundo donax TaxID=35708 RepID=A0A0A8YEG3_ARUDO